MAGATVSNVSATIYDLFVLSGGWESYPPLNPITVSVVSGTLYFNEWCIKPRVCYRMGNQWKVLMADEGRWLVAIMSCAGEFFFRVVDSPHKTYLKRKTTPLLFCFLCKSWLANYELVFWQVSNNTYVMEFWHEQWSKS